MKYKTFKKCTKDFEEIYTKEKETKAIEIELDGINIFITEQQLGSPLKEPHIEISVADGYTYSMDLLTLIKNL